MPRYFFPLFLLCVPVTLGHGDSNGNGFSFVGDEHWNSWHRYLCENPHEQTNYQRADVSCYQQVVFYTWLRIEVLNWHPFLVVLRHFASPVQIERFLDDVTLKQLVMQQVVNENQKDDGEKEVYHTSRRANGTWFDHRETLGTSQMFDYTIDRLPYVNFDSAEMWQVLSYNPGGHYAPHYDYLEYASESQWDWWMSTFGNRFATFLLVLKTADEGGGTVFPRLNVTITPNAGDVIFWANMNINGNIEADSLHGACPILKGTKIAATLWIRQHEQLFKIYCKAFPPKDFLETVIDPLYFLKESATENSIINKNDISD